jgi:transcriptional regulator NrdR family protein
MDASSPTRTDYRDHVGLRCRRCGHQQFRVLYTRPRHGGTVVRRRECRQCGERFTTWERPVGA